MGIFAEWGPRHLGLFTFPQSPKHIALYQKFGFSARFLTPIMSKPIQAPSQRVNWSRFSAVPSTERAACLQSCRDVTNSIYEGLDLEREIRSVEMQKLGDTLLLRDQAGIAGFAVCHCGPRTEAGSGTCYVKFGAVHSGTDAPGLFEQLLDACEDFAAGQGLQVISAGVNMARHEAYRIMIERSFRTLIQGVAMQRPNTEGFNRSGVYVIDDWR
jgi:hypothetical protein